MDSEPPSNIVEKPFRFTLWDLLALTTYIAVLFGLPREPLGFLVAVSLTSALLLAFPAWSGKIFKPVAERPVSRTISRTAARVFLFLLVTIFVGGIALIARPH